MDRLIRLIGTRLKERYGAKEVILFGSYARGQANKDSDIYLLIIAETEEGFFKRQATVRRILRGLGRKTPVSPIVLTPDEVQVRAKALDHFINDILATGTRT